MSQPPSCPSARDETYDLRLLERSHAKWQRSAALRVCYGDIYGEMARLASVGPALEIGSGCGFIREFIPGVVTSDVCKTRFVDREASAYALETVEGGPWSTIYLLDVLHHLREPMRFFASAARALRDGGRIVMVEPAATPFGRTFYRLCHHEPIEPERVREPYVFSADTPNGDFANMGMAWALFRRDRTEVESRLRELGIRISAVRYRDLVCYPASGGFSRPAFLPAGLLRLGLAIERLLPQWLMARLALRMVVALEKC